MIGIVMDLFSSEKPGLERSGTVGASVKYVTPQLPENDDDDDDVENASLLVVPPGVVPTDAFVEEDDAACELGDFEEVSDEPESAPFSSFCLRLTETL